MNRHRWRLTAAALCLGLYLSGCGQGRDRAGRAEWEQESGGLESDRELGGGLEPDREPGRLEPEQESGGGSGQEGETAGQGGQETEDTGPGFSREREPGTGGGLEMTSETPEETAGGGDRKPSVVPPKDSLVRVREYIPDILVDLKYSSEDNFTNQKIYDFTEAYLRYGTIEKLQRAQEAVREQGMVLKIWDGYRPVSAQFKLWDVCPDPVYVANPNKGFSSHSRGNTVDITLVYEDGTEVEMPTGFDDFSPMADRDYSDCTAVAAENALLLEGIMKECGFKPYSGEWWHFSDTETYPVEEFFEPGQENDETQ